MEAAEAAGAVRTATAARSEALVKGAAAEEAVAQLAAADKQAVSAQKAAEKALAVVASAPMRAAVEALEVDTSHSHTLSHLNSLQTPSLSLLSFSFSVLFCLI